jgi:hypothetical protein
MLGLARRSSGGDRGARRARIAAGAEEASHAVALARRMTTASAIRATARGEGAVAVAGEEEAEWQEGDRADQVAGVDGGVAGLVCRGKLQGGARWDVPRLPRTRQKGRHSRFRTNGHR